MRTALLAVVLAAIASQASAETQELVTADNAVLCLSAGNVGEATRSGRSQERLRGMQCLRIHSGIPLTVLDGDDPAGPWKIRFRPEGISGGITMWGLPSSFALPDGTQLRRTRRAAR
jgi:hypothetical protein